MFQATLSGLAVGSLFALIAVGFNLTFIVNRTVNFAHGQWVAVGLLLAFTLLVEWQMPLLVTIIGTGVLLGILGVALERVGIRPMLGHSLSLGFIMSTLAIGIVLENAALWSRRSQGSAARCSRPRTPTSPPTSSPSTSPS